MFLGVADLHDHDVLHSTAHALLHGPSLICKSMLRRDMCALYSSVAGDLGGQGTLRPYHSD